MFDATPGCLVDPHTACGVRAAFALISDRNGDGEALAAVDAATSAGGSGMGCVAMACAHVAKFPRAAARALAGSAEREAAAAKALSAEARANASVQKCEKMRYTDAELPAQEKREEREGGAGSKLPVAAPVARAEVEKACVALLEAGKKDKWEGQVRAVIEGISLARRV